MKLSEFDYPLPKELIAQYPLEERDTARLLVLDRKQCTIEHRIFKNIVDYFRQGDLIVLNNTKVSPSRLIGSRVTGGKVELLLLKAKSGLTFEALIKPSRTKLKEKIIFNGSTSLTINPERSRSFNGSASLTINPERSRRIKFIKICLKEDRQDSKSQKMSLIPSFWIWPE